MKLNQLGRLTRQLQSIKICYVQMCSFAIMEKLNRELLLNEWVHVCACVTSKGTFDACVIKDHNVVE